MEKFELWDGTNLRSWLQTKAGLANEGQQGLWERLGKLEEKVEHMRKILEGDGNGWGLQQNIYGDGTKWGLMQHIHGDGKAWGLRQHMHGNGEVWGLRQHVHGTGQSGEEGLWERLCKLEDSLNEEREKNKALEAKLQELLTEAVRKQLGDK